jgi:hypothetical protein
MYKKIILGTMRLDSNTKSAHYWADLLNFAFENGIHKLHCSDEYESYPLLIEILKILRRDFPKCQFEFIVKLAEPHFGNTKFNSEKFHSRIRSYLEDLQIDTISSIQWMWRGDLSEEADRLDGFERFQEIFNQEVTLAKSRGMTNKIHCFPYTRKFAEIALSSRCVDGLAFYRNPNETEFDEFLPLLESANKTALVIRPFAAGKLTNSTQTKSLIEYSSELQCVEGIILSCSSKKHLEQCIGKPAS